ncbi:MAG: hypothetical protein NTZ26_00110, partial [Candidatus Aminicenantes bacterium]|nr:hypothetical protein [Candidatus Aminicenantes bacterium]
MRSLRLKLVVGSLLLLTAVILGFDAFFFLAKRSALLDALDSRLFVAAQALEKRLEIKDGKPAFDPDDEGRTEAAPEAARPIRITDENGRVLHQSASPIDAVWPSSPRDAAAPAWKTVPAGGGRAWRILTWVDRIEIDKDAAEKGAAGGEGTIAVTIQCAEPLAALREELRELGSLLALLSLAAFLTAGGGSFVLAGRALRPIRRINEALAGISASRLDARIDATEFDRELHPLIDQLNGALDRLERGFRQERQFTADASHELRTPLAAILNTIEVLLRRPRAEAELVEAHRDNWRTARSMQTIIEGLLLLARMDAGK